MLGIDVDRWEERIFDKVGQPTVSGVIYQAKEKTIAKVYDEKHDRFKRIAQRKAGVDDDVVINNSVDKIYRKGGGILKLSSGEYYVRDIILRKRVDICGEGYSTILYPKDGATTIFKWDQDTMSPAQVTLSDMCLDGQGLNVDAIWLKGGYWFRLRNLKIYNFKGYGINFAYTWDSDVISCNIYNCGSTINSKSGVALGTINNTNGIKFIATHIGACDYANIHLTNKAARTYIILCRCETGGRSPNWVLYCEPYSYRNFIANNVFAGSVNDSVVSIGIGTTFFGNEIEHHSGVGLKVFRDFVRVLGNFIHGADNGGDAIYVTGAAKDVVIADNTITTPQGSGIYFDWQLVPFIVIGNDIRDVGKHGIHVRGDVSYNSYGIIADNIINNVNRLGAKYYGILIEGIKSIKVALNQILTNNAEYSIYELATDYNKIIDNTVDAPIHKVGVNTIVKNNVGYSTDSFLYTGLSVVVGGGSYGSPTTITSLSGIISSFDAILHVTAGVGEDITVKFECVWDDGTTTYITKSLDNSSGTAAVSQDYEITVADKIALWKNGSSLRKINVYAMSNLNPPTTSAKVTVDIAGSG